MMSESQKESAAPAVLQAVGQPQRIAWKRLLAGLARVGIGAILLVSGYTHISNPYQFLQSIYGYKPLYDWLVAYGWLAIFLAGFLPFLHLSLGVALLTRDELLRTAFILSAALLAVYTIVQSVALSQGLKISCGCFSSYQTDLIGYRSIGVAASACVLSLAGFWASRQRTSPAPTATGFCAAGVSPVAGCHDNAYSAARHISGHGA